MHLVFPGPQGQARSSQPSPSLLLQHLDLSASWAFEFYTHVFQVFAKKQLEFTNVGPCAQSELSLLLEGTVSHAVSEVMRDERLHWD